jgi:hypothetical protein
MAARRKNPELVDEVVKLREEYLEMLHQGLGMEALSPGEERQRLDAFEERVTEIFIMHAKIRLAKKLGIEDWLRATVTSSFPEGWQQGDDDTGQEEPTE